MQETEVVLSVIRARGSRARGKNRWRARCIERMHAGFGGRLHGKGPHPHGIRDLAVQPTLLPVLRQDLKIRLFPGRQTSGRGENR